MKNKLTPIVLSPILAGLPKASIKISHSVYPDTVSFNQFQQHIRGLDNPPTASVSSHPHLFRKKAK